MDAIYSVEVFPLFGCSLAQYYIAYNLVSLYGRFHIRAAGIVKEWHLTLEVRASLLSLNIAEVFR